MDSTHQISGTPAISDAERNARIDLAAAHRLAVVFGWGNLNNNHIALRVPGEPGNFLFKRDELLFEEVTASNLIKLDMRGTVVDGSGARTNPGYTIHAAVLQARPDVNCVVHVHTEYGMAMSAHKRGLLPISQDAMHFYNRVGYNDYDGLSTSGNQREKLAADLGKNWALFMRNHGPLTCASSVPVAVLLMRYLVMSCHAQLLLEASGAELVLPPHEVCEEVARRWEQTYAKEPPVPATWGAMLRMLEPAHSDYRR